MENIVNVTPKGKGTVLLNVKDPTTGEVTLKEYTQGRNYYVSPEFYRANATYFKIASSTSGAKFSTDGKYGENDKRALKRHLRNLSLGELFDEAKRLGLPPSNDRDLMTDQIFRKRVLTGEVVIARKKFPPIEKITKRDLA